MITSSQLSYNADEILGSNVSERLIATFERHAAQRHGGMAFSVYRAGEPIIELNAGVAGKHGDTSARARGVRRLPCDDLRLTDVREHPSRHRPQCGPMAARSRHILRTTPRAAPSSTACMPHCWSRAAASAGDSSHPRPWGNALQTRAEGLDVLNDRRLHFGLGFELTDPIGTYGPVDRRAKDLLQALARR